MKSNINLYHPRFEPRVDYLSLSSVVFVLVICTVLVLITGLTFRFWANAVEDEYITLAQKNTALQEQVDALQTEVTNWKPDAMLVAKVESVKADLARQARVLEELASRAPLRFKGFGQLFNDLANRASSDLWIESMMVSETQMEFIGALSTPSAFPKWLQRLSHTESFSGKDFEAAKVYMEDEALKFALTTQRTADAVENSTPRQAPSQIQLPSSDTRSSVPVNPVPLPATLPDVGVVQ